MRRWFGIRVQRPGPAAAAAAILLCIMAGHTVLETARDSLFLTRLPVAKLPFAYALIAVGVLIAAELDRRLRPRRLSQRRALSLTLLVGAAGALAFIQAFRLHASWAPIALYGWVALIASLGLSQFWLLLSERFSVAEAKRLYALIGAGGLVGAALGGGLAHELAKRFGDGALLATGACLLAVAACVPGLSSLDVAAPRESLLPGATTPKAALRDLRGEQYLRRLLALTLVSTVAVTLVDFLFKAEVARVVPPAELAEFFGSFNACLSVAALVAQVLLAPRLLHALGVGRALLVLPSALAVGVAGTLLAPGLAAFVLLRGVDGSLRFSLHKSAVELLYLPLTSQARTRWKMAADALGQRGGQALASLIILGCLSASLSPTMLAGLALALSVLWLVLAATIESHYLAVFRAKIRAGAVETRPDVPELDLRSLESLVAALGSESDDEVLAAIDLLVDYDRARVIPALLLLHPSRAVVIRALEVLMKSGRRDFTGGARRLLARDDDEVRAAAMLALSGHMSADELRRELTVEMPIAARASVLVALTARGLDEDGAFAAEIERGIASSAALCTRISFARAFRLRGDHCCVPRLVRLAQQAAPDLRIEVARAMLAVPDAAYLPALLPMLGQREVRPIARDALCAIGEPALAALDRAFDDPELPRNVRAHLPRSMSRFGTAAATDLLLERLAREADGWVRFKIVRGLGRLRPHLRRHGRPTRVLEFAQHNLLRAVQFMALRLATELDRLADARLATPGGELLLAVLQEKEAHAIDRAVRLVGLLHSANVIHNIRQALTGADLRLRGDGIELLLHEAPQDIGRALSALLEAGPGQARLERAAEALRERIVPRSYEQRLQLLLESHSEPVRCLAAYHAGELGLKGLSDAVARAAERDGGMSREVFARVRAQLALIKAPPAPLGTALHSHLGTRSARER